MALPYTTFPEPPASYDVTEQAAFRRDISRALQEINLHMEAKGSTTSPAALGSGNNNNYDIGADASIVRLTPNGAGSTITGIVAGKGEREVRLINLGSADITLAHQDSNSTAANRFLISSGANFVLKADQSVDITYDSVTSRWRANVASTGRTGTQSATLANGNNNNFSLNADAVLLRLTADGTFGGSTLTGITGGEAGRVLLVWCVTVSSQSLTLTNEDGASTAANRLALTAGGINMSERRGFVFIYDGVAQRWTIA